MSMSEKKHYELMFIIPAKFAGEELGTLRDKVKKVLLDNEAEITKETEMGRKRLNYPIKNVYQGFYFVTEFDLLGEKLEAIHTELKLMPEVLRYMIVKKRVLSETEEKA